MQPLTFDQLRTLPTVVDLMTAARALGIGRTKAYQLAQRDRFPCRLLRVGNSYHVPTAELWQVLGLDAPHHLGSASAWTREPTTRPG